MLDSSRRKEFFTFTIKVIVTHSLTYFIFGLIMSNIFDYGRIFQQEIIKEYMRPIESTNVLAGPFLQPIRGLLFALGIWPLRTLILEKRYGWLILWNIIIIFGILSTPAAAPCSIEGVLYTRLPLWYHIMGLAEILLQTLVFSLILVWWDKQSLQRQAISQQSKLKRQFIYFAMTIMIACFAYVGYAIGGILSAMIAGVEIDIKGASVDFKGQMMFFVAFIINILSINFFSRKLIKGKLNYFITFIIFWIIETIVPIIYQYLFLDIMPFYLALILGFFPATIIVLSLFFNRDNLIELNLV